MKSVQVSRRAFLKASKVVAAGMVLSPAIIGACAGRHAETQMLVVAAERSEICQRPRLL